MANGQQLSSVLHYLRRAVGAPLAGNGTDRDLLARFAGSRDAEAFGQLMARHAGQVFAVCRRVLGDDAAAEDAFQATFLVLARQAAALAPGESLACWLHGVAYRTALMARRGQRRRDYHEQQAGALRPEATEPSIEWPELRRLLDDELQRLPAKYRLPLILCYLNGKTRDEAAEELGWSLGALKGCLERGRQLLRERLERRGLTLSAALLGTLLTTASATAVPAPLMNLTLQAAAGGVPSAAVMVLVKGVLHAMFWNKMRVGVTAAVVVALGVGLGAVGVTAAMQETERPPPPTVVALAPLPPEAKNVKAAAEPVVKDGLAVVLTAAQATFTEAESLDFALRWTNIGDISLLLGDGGSGLNEFVFEDQASGTRWGWRNFFPGPPPAGAPPALFELQPKQASNLRIVFQTGQFSRFVKENDKPSRETGLLSLPRGKYRVSTRLQFADLPPQAAQQALLQKGQARRWFGIVAPNPVEIESSLTRRPGTSCQRPCWTRQRA